MRSIIVIMPLFIALLGFMIWGILRVRKTQPGFKVMLLGVAVILTGGIIILDTSSGIGGLEYLFVLVGLLISVLGFTKIDN